MGNSEIHELSKEKFLKRNFLLEQLQLSQIGNGNNYRYIGGKYYPELTILFPTRDLVLNIKKNTYVENCFIPVIFHTESSFELVPMEWQLQAIFSSFKDFKKSFYNSQQSIEIFSESGNRKIYFARGFRFTSEQVGLEVWQSLQDYQRSNWNLKYYVMIRLCNVITGETGPYSSSSSFSLAFKLAKQVKGFRFPNISQQEIFDSEGYYYDGSIYYSGVIL